MLKRQYPVWSRTAAAAIGYKEFFEEDTPNGDARAALDAVRERIYIRTCRLAKRQDTWFRHQARAMYVDVADTEDETAARVDAVWQAHGPWEVRFDAP